MRQSALYYQRSSVQKPLMSSSHKKVIVRRFTGDVLSGYLPLSGFVRHRSLDLLDLSGHIIPLFLNDIKLISYVRDFNLSSPAAAFSLARVPKASGSDSPSAQPETFSKASPRSTSPSSTTLSTMPASSSHRPTPVPTPSASTSPVPPSTSFNSSPSSPPPPVASHPLRPLKSPHSSRISSTPHCHPTADPTNYNHHHEVS
jgi:hypothetical protein